MRGLQLKKGKLGLSVKLHLQISWHSRFQIRVRPHGIALIAMSVMGIVVKLHCRIRKCKPAAYVVQNDSLV